MIIIDSDNYAHSGIQTMVFPGGEPHVKVPTFEEDVMLYLKLRTWLDVGYAMCLMDALRAQGVPKMDSFIPYFPAARQDRTDGHSPLTCALMVEMLGRSDCTYVFDIHSNATLGEFLAHRKNCINVMPHNLRIDSQWKDVDAVIAPDAGAKDRAEAFRSMYCPDAILLQCDKKRNFATGKFEGYTLPDLPFIGKYLVVDDICDGGGTFNLLAEAFEADNYGHQSELNLWVSHGIFSRGLSNIHEKYKRIWTTDSFTQLGNTKAPYLTVIPLAGQLEI